MHALALSHEHTEDLHRPNTVGAEPLTRWSWTHVVQYGSDRQAIAAPRCADLTTRHHLWLNAYNRPLVGFFEGR